MSIETNEQKKDALRIGRHDAREAALLSVMARHRITLPRNAIEWRVPVEKTTGYIQGITLGSVELLCTDGIVAWFGFSDGTTLFGHMQHFVTDVKKTYSGPRKPSSTQPSNRRTTHERALAMLKANLAALGVDV